MNITINKPGFTFTASFNRWGLGTVYERWTLMHVIRIYILRLFIQIAWSSKRRKGE